MSGLHTFPYGTHEILYRVALWVIWVRFDVLDPIICREFSKPGGIEWGPVICLMCFRLTKISIDFG